MLDQFGKERDRLRIEVHLLKIGVQEAIQRHNVTIGCLPCYVKHIADMDHPPLFRLGNHPIKLAPAGLPAAIPPVNGQQLALGRKDIELPPLYLLGIPGDRLSGPQLLALPHNILLKGAPLDLHQLIVLALESSQGLVAHHLRQHPARLFPGGCQDVHPLEKVGVAGEQLDPGLGCTAR